MKKIILVILAFLGISYPNIYARAASLPRLFELPFNTGLRRGDLIDYVGDLIRTLLLIIGTILLVIVVYGGFLYLTSTGEEARIKKARNTLTYALIGFVIIAGAFIVSDFIIKNVLR